MDDNRQQVEELAQRVVKSTQDGYNPTQVADWIEQMKMLVWEDEGFPPFGLDDENGADAP